MRKSFKTLALLVVACVTFGLMSGCGGNGSNDGAVANKSINEGDEVQKSETAKDDRGGQTVPGVFKKYDPPVEISISTAIKQEDFRNGDTLENNPLTRWMLDNMGVKLSYKWVLADQNDAFNTKVRLALASGDELPDVMYINDLVVMDELIKSGKIESVDEAYEKYASERTKQTFDKNAVVWNQVTSDGKRWGLPTIADPVVGDVVMWVRQDWLDAVGMKAPTNVAELDAVLAAFKKKFPDKTPLAVAGKSLLTWWMGDTQFMFGTSQPMTWNEDSSGKLQYGSIQPGIKGALTKLNDFYNKGYMGKEFGTNDEMQASSLFTSGNAGIIFGAGWMGGWPLNETAKNVPGAVVKAYPLPSGADGTVGRHGSKLSYGSYVFRKGFDHFDAIFYYWDTTLGRALEDPNSPFAAGMAEGYDYVMKDGKPDWKDIPNGASAAIQQFALLDPGAAPGMIEGPAIYERVASGKKDNIYEQKLAENTEPLVIEGNMAAYSQPGIDRTDLFNGASTKTMTDKWSLLFKSETETFLKIIYGKASPGEFDTFVEKWKENGGEQITKEVNDWYQSTKRG
ncbi:aldotetraouronic acid ABC transporter substrate-binding protein /aldotetraouronic acid ABC transporter substrate-binding protein [Paenibacillus taihuensis]|uniref:Aldotetraouronic acid ABC transporter substrate-binding protein /aldotetraouronic acid ABC transporter substrate-binding protein n=1 Tax=Paenibacillus taihuensis TaxID=1156355 RepID=A0A3D9QZV1_9BACL|nr:extracellular solute-binding protein [Paenibacillus taihuensis]REE66657.1 aldotetraouronic acid ABC transporter substrate-binding protein /aldotetraouronic acid ABC transporter substrate-binding protein [Paenibacillus taihuensis]